MEKQCTAANPFVLMMDPESVLQAVERSERLQSLKRQVCRPLDRSSLPGAASAADVLTDGGEEAEADA